MSKRILLLAFVVAATMLFAGLAQAAPGTVSVYNNLNIAGATDAWTGQYDISNNNAVVTSPGGSIATITNQVKSGLKIAGPLWTGQGITSSTAAAGALADPNGTGTTAVGAIPNVYDGNPIYTTWPVGADSPNAVGVSLNDVLIKYTYWGDADMNGVVDGATDYDLWAQGRASGGALGGWLYGDFDYNGVVDGATDYDLWATGRAGQGSPQASASTVPEPSTFALLAIASVSGLAFALRRRRS